MTPFSVGVPGNCPGWPPSGASHGPERWRAQWGRAQGPERLALGQPVVGWAGGRGHLGWPESVRVGIVSPPHG